MTHNYRARVLAVLLSVMLVLSLAGCRNSNQADDSSGSRTSQTETVTGSPADKEFAGTANETAEKKDSEKERAKTKKAKKAADKEVASSTQSDVTTPSKKTSQTASQKKSTSTTTKKTATQPAKKAPQRRSLVGEALELTGEVQRMLIGTVDVGSGGIIYQNPKDATVSVRVRTKRNSDGGLQLYLVVKNKTGRPIRLNGYSNFAIRDLFGNELLSTDIALNKPVIMNDQDEQLISLRLPREWYDLDDLYQLSVEAGIFNSIIALDYDFL